MTEAQLDALMPGERLPMAVGDVIADTYRIEKILGTGSISVVATAVRGQESDARSNQVSRVALKMMRKTRATDASMTIFTNEVKRALPLKNVHVAQILDVNVAKNGLPFVAMELLEGHNVATILERQGVLKPYLAIDYVSQACEALQDAHKLDLVHRDLCPKNLFLTQQASDGAPLIKVLDFGTARIAHDAILKKKPMYMAPEQLKTPDDIDARADIWAMGAVLFELVTGHQAFGGASIAEILTKISDRSPPSLEVYLPNAPPGLSTVIHRCLEKDRKKRYATAGALLMALSDLGAKPSMSPGPAWDRSIDLNVAPLLTADAVPSSERSPPSSSRRPPAALPVTPMGGIPRKGTAAATYVIPRPPRRGPLVVLAAIAIAGGMLSGALVYRQRVKNKLLLTAAPTMTSVATITPSAAMSATIPSAAPIESTPPPPPASTPSGRPHRPKKR